MAELISIPVKQIQPLVWKAGTLIQAMSAFISRFRTWAQIRSMLNSEWMCVCVTLRSICPLLIVWKNALYFPAVAQNDLHLDSGALGNLPEGNGIWVASHPVHWSAHEKRLECNRLNLSQPSCDFFLKIIPSAFKSEFHVCATKLGDWLYTCLSSHTWIWPWSWSIMSVLSYTLVLARPWFLECVASANVVIPAHQQVLECCLTLSPTPLPMQDEGRPLPGTSIICWKSPPCWKQEA